jgi:hypothetical protein
VQDEVCSKTLDTADIVREEIYRQRELKRQCLNLDVIVKRAEGIIPTAQVTTSTRIDF